MLKLLITFTLVSSSAHALFGKIEEKVYATQTPKWFLELLISRPEITIDHFSKKGIEIYGPKGTIEWIYNLGIETDNLYFELQNIKINSLSYPSFNHIKNILTSLNQSFPKITKLFSIGKSVEGRDLLVMKISDNPEIDETEPEFKYISSMHGDEITGRELTVMLIRDLLNSYGKDPKITSLINNTEIFIMPSMNPDGSERQQRANANFYDLNRNFPNWDDSKETLVRRQPETVAVMNFQKERQFSMSANFHGGAVCVNYPWDSTLIRHPFDRLLKKLSLTYSIHNPPMYHSTEFNQGITNGADWYVVRGGMQDWSYVFHNDLQVTVELSDEKWPDYSEISQFYKDNKKSMLRFLEHIHQGAGFKLNSKISGKTKITKVEGNKKTDLGTYNFKDGEFYKVLEDGIYIFDIEMSNGNRRILETSVSKNDILAKSNYMFID